MPLHAHFFQHVPFEGLGSIGDWLAGRGAVVTTTRFFADAVLPDADGIDLLILMGGPMSVNDEGYYPWLVAEKRFVAEVITRGKAVLGVCLGAQLIAAALGGRVHPNGEKEIGWFPVASLPPRDAAPARAVPSFRFPEESLVFHWHGETFDLPAGAVHLARSEACRNQAFQYGRRVMGLQFHLEMTPQAVAAIVDAGRDELVPARWVQPAAEILAAGPERYGSNNRLMAEILSFLTAPPAG
ncbi:MAG: type 1 glutamine amidotransferase [Syntrophales bacterium]